MLLNKYFASMKEAKSLSKQDEFSNGENNMEDFLIEDDLAIDDGLDTNLVLEMEELKLEHLKLQEAQLKCKQRMILLNCIGKNTAQKPATNRCILPDGRIVVQNSSNRSEYGDNALSAAGDSRAPTCSCEQHPWNEPSDSSTPSTCVLCCKDRDKDKTDKSKDLDRCDAATSRSVDFKKSDYYGKSEATKTVGRQFDYTKKSENSDVNIKSSIKCDIDCDSKAGPDETDRLTKLRIVDYMDIVDDNLKIVIALSGYPTSEMQLKQMQIFQRSLNDIKDMQSKEGLLKSTPMFIDYYLNKGAIMCICKNKDTRDWLVRILPGLQERMKEELVLLRAKFRRLYLGVIKTPKSYWPASAKDTFKLLQYFNPTLKTNLWQIYTRSVIDDVEVTYFCIDRVSREIMRGASFKNVINFDEIDFEFGDTIEMYYDNYLTDGDEDLSSIASRFRLLQELKSNDTTSRNESENEGVNDKKLNDVNNDVDEKINKQSFEIMETTECQNNSDLEKVIDITVTKHTTDDQNTSENRADNYRCRNRKDSEIELIDASTTTFETFEETESESEMRNSNVNVNSSRGIAYHRRTNYLHVEDELKTAIVLEGYPNNKLDGVAIKRLKQLFKDCLHKDVKLRRFRDRIIPKFHDVYLSNGAVIYICDTLETKEYLLELLPRFINSTGLKLTFRDIKNLVRYTRVIMKLPQELSSVESHDILHALNLKYPKLNADCFKYYSNVTGKRKREFGVDRDSLEVIKNPNFEPIYKGEMLNFRIIDRQQKREKENRIEDAENESKRTKKHEDLLKIMYCPIDSDILNISLTRIRASHYSDLIEDDLKLYIGPFDYPQTRINENDFHTIKKTLEFFILDTYDKCFESVPKFHDVYLFDGVIFLICKDTSSRDWVEKNIANINSKIEINLKVTEFRGAVGIISMVARTNKDADEVVAILQKQNPRLRTKFWRKINTIRTSMKLDVVVQIDKLSALVINDKDFNGKIEGCDVEFNLEYLESLLKPEMSLQELIKARNENTLNRSSDVPKNVLTEVNPNVIDRTNKTQDKFNSRFNDKENVDSPRSILSNIRDSDFPIYTEFNSRFNDKENVDSPRSIFNNIRDSDFPIYTEFNSRFNDKENVDSPRSILSNIRDSDFPIYIDTEKNSDSSVMSTRNDEQEYCRIILKVPTSIQRLCIYGLDIILDLLEENNPGLNTVLWKNERRSKYNPGKFYVLIDKESAAFMKKQNFNPTLLGHKLDIRILDSHSFNFVDY
ncbi:unnamed protein product [Euphydryas editha]|uniref:DUF4780 domain-containing protein n=1 Tax=Euphydryas editha TaxID=104508 RepID=A0AAU9T9N5_EUPED|nr:unnamed protein product [Euphydryas editha]